MIDAAALQAAYERDGVYALQLEVNDACDQGCSYCYMNALPVPERVLGDDEVVSVLDDAAALGVTAVEWLGGEPLDRPGVLDLMGYARGLGLRNNVWTGGLPLARGTVAESLARLAAEGLVSVHVSTLDRDLYEYMHPGRTADDIDTILFGIEHLIDSGYPAERMLNSTTLTGLQTAEDAIATIDVFEKRYGILTSLNVYHTYLRPDTPPGELERFIPSAGSVRAVHRRYERQWGGPRPMNCVDKRYCSATVAVLNDGAVTPCATIREGPGSVRGQGGLVAALECHREELLLLPLKKGEVRLEQCEKCRMGEECWGCRSRAYASGAGLYGPDPRCYRQRRVA